MLDYERKLTGILAHNKRYPPEAVSRGEHGTVIVSFTLDREGQLIDSQVKQTSGSAILDQAAIELVKRSQPFPPLPSDYSGARIQLRLPVTFKLPIPTVTNERQAVV
jgi:periplasmic protein TonB